MSVAMKWLLFTLMLPIYLLAAVGQVLADWVTYPYREAHRRDS